MIWMLWRQHRVPVAIAAAVLGSFAIPALITGSHLATALNECRNATCGDLFDGYKAINIIVDLTIMVPLLIGVFWGATIIGKELETGTATLAWTQSVTRRHWITMKLLTLFGFAVLTSGAVTALVTWWSNAHNAMVESRFTGLQFDIQGIVPIAYAIFASAVGLAAGVILRRSLPAMATTVGVFVGVRLLVELAFRPGYMTPVVHTNNLDAERGIPAGSLGIDSQIYHNGHLLTGNSIQVPNACAQNLSRPAMDACMRAQGYQMRDTFQPASRWWPFQWIESGIFVAMAVALTVLAVVWLRRRDA